MDDETRKTVLTAYQERKQEKLRHPFLDEKTTVGMLVHLQAQLLRLRSDKIEPADADDESWVNDVSGNEEENVVNLSIDLDGIAARIEALPLPSANYRQLSAGEDAVFYLTGDKADYNRFEYRALDPDIFLARLARRPLSYWTRRYSEDQNTPVFANRAHMVFLTNRQAGSGGDEIVYEFRRKKMGPIVGTRTWGGLVGVLMFLRLSDGSFLTALDYRMYSPEANWVVENEGVSPDIEVELDPAEMQRGHGASSPS